VAQEFSIAIVCVTHFAKDTSRSMLHRVMASAAFVQTCRSLCAVVSRPDEGPWSKALLQVKMNLPDHPGGGWRFVTERVEVGADRRNGRPIHATRPDWDALDPYLTPDNAVGKATGGPTSQYLFLFIQFLRECFRNAPPDGYLPITQVKAAALAAGAISESWWRDHSGDYLDKQNRGGTFYCKPTNI
jgi:hypothetical protein